MIMVDEPSLGLAPLLIETVYECFQCLRADGVTLLIIEQSTSRVMRVADKAYVLNNGSVVLSGRAEEIDRGMAFENAYFGKGSTYPCPVE